MADRVFGTTSHADATGTRLPRALAALCSEAVALQRRADDGETRARALGAREAELEAVRVQLEGSAGWREELMQGFLAELNRVKVQISKLDGKLRRWEARGNEDSDSDGGRSSEDDEEKVVAEAPAAEAETGPSGVAPAQAADEDEDLLAFA